ncbi:MAG: PKD domain-containing protein [Haloferacaceae archaeon]
MKQFTAIVLTLLMVTSVVATGATSIGLGVVSAAETDDALLPGEIDTCGVIETPGTYILTTDVDNGGSADPCFEIKSSDVLLNGNGFTVSNGTAEAIHVLASGSGSGGTALTNVTVTNLRIEGWETGISGKGVRDSTFENNVFRDNGDKGIALSGKSTRDVAIVGNTFERNPKAVFLELGVQRTTIDGNDFVGNQEAAVKVTGASDTTLTNNYFTGHTGEKTVHITSRSPNNVVENNVFEHNVGPENALQIGGESGSNVIRNNVVRTSGAGGIQLGPGDNVVEGNEIYDNVGVGLTLEGGNNTVSDNRVYDNNYGLWLAASSGNVLTDNVVENNDVWDVFSFEGATNNEFVGLSLGDATIDVGPTSVDFALIGASDPGVGTPGDYALVGGVVEGAATSDVGTLDLTVHYDESALGGAPESNVVLARTDGVTTWAGVRGVNEVDTGANSVRAVVTEFGFLAPLAGSTPDEIVPPVADAGADVATIVNSTVDFDASGSSDDVGIASYVWNFGDGAVVTDGDPYIAHTYTHSGEFTVVLTVTDTSGNAASDDLTVTVASDDTEAPVAVVAGGDRETLVGSSLTFDGSDSTDNVAIVSYEWDFGDGGNATGAVVDHTYTANGTYTVTLTVTDLAGNRDSATVTVETVTVDEAAPAAVIAGGDRAVELATDVTFDGSASTDNVQIATYAWTFGDGATASGPVVTHAYAAEGNYTVTLTVRDTSGNEATASVNVTAVEEFSLSPGPIDTCGVLEEAGVYTLTTDLDGGDVVATCFEIRGSDVTLDGQGHTISNGVAEAIHVLNATATLTNVTVTNLTVTGWGSAISAKNVRDSEFSDLALAFNDDKGIALSGTESTDNRVLRDRFEENEKGLFVERGANNTVVEDSDFLANHEAAVKVSGASGTTLRRNFFTGHDGEKVVHFSGESPGNLLEYNRIEHSTEPENAIQFGGESSGNTVRHNVVVGNDRGGIQFGPGDNVVVNNTVADNGGVGMAFDGDNDVVTDNVVTGNGDGVWFGGSTGETATDNVVADNDGYDVSFDEGATGNAVTGLTVTGGTVVDLGTDTTDVTLTGVADPGAPLPTGYATIGKFLLASGLSDGALLDLSVHYAVPGDVDAANQSDLLVGRTADETVTWVGVPGASVDTTAGVVSATVTEFTAGGDYLAPMYGTGDVTPPVADAGAETVVALPNETVTFDASASYDGAAATLTYLWGFGDGTTNTSAVADHTFTDEGTYTVTLTVSDGTYEDTDAVTVYVDGTDPVADAGPDVLVGTGKMVEFDATGSTDGETHLVGYEWDFGDGTTGTGAEPVHGYFEEGTFVVTLTVTDAAGNEDTDVVNVTVDATVPVAVIGGDEVRTVTVGDLVTFDGSQSTDDVGIDGYEWTFGDGGSAIGPVVTHAYTAVGTYTVTLTVTDGAGNTDGEDATVVVVSPSSGGGDDGSDDSSGGSGDDGASGGGRSATGGSATTQLRGAFATRDADGTFHVNVRGARADEGMKAALTWSAPDAATGIQLRQSTATRSVGGDYQYTIRVGSQVASGVPALPTAVGYVDVTHEAPEEEFTGATFTYRIATQRLERAGLTPEDVALYRYEHGEWVRMQTEMRERTESEVTFRSTAPGLSHFAVVGTVPHLAVEDAALDATTLDVGGEATVTATVANDGMGDGDVDVALTVNGDVVATKTVTLAVGETATVTFAHAFAEAGAYDVSVGDRSLDTVSVAARQATTAESTTTEPTTAEPTTAVRERTPGFGVVVAVVALLAAALLALRRTRR